MTGCGLEAGRQRGQKPAKLGDDLGAGQVGRVAEQRGEPAAARSCHLQSLTAATRLGDPQAVAQALTGLAGAETRNMWTTLVVTRGEGGWRIAAIRNMLPAAPAAG